MLDSKSITAIGCHKGTFDFHGLMVTFEGHHIKVYLQ